MITDPTTDPGNRDAGKLKPSEMVRLSPRVWALFLLVVAAAIAADLGLKVWAFENVAGTPIRLRLSDSGKPEVLVPSDVEEGGWTVFSRVGVNGEPPQVPRHDPIVVVPGLLNFQLTLNTGAVFGSGQGGRPIFITVSIIAVGVIVVLVYRSPRKAWFYQLGLALILGGAIGNLYDRTRFAAVRDMLHMLPETRLWPWIFNPADVALVVGVGMVLVVSWFSERGKAKQAQAAKA